MEDKEKKEYEISFLVRQEEEAKEVASALKRHGAEISYEGPLNKIHLAYPIKRETNAHFGFFWFFAAPEAIAQVEHDLRLSKEVLRFLVVVNPVKKSTPEKREVREVHKVSPPATMAPVAALPKEKELTNEDLERKLEEILK